jgi:hypothetical protein
MRQLLVAAAARAGAAAAGQAPPGGAYLERTAQRRWDMLRMLVDFQKAHRWGVVWVGGLRMRRVGSYSHMSAKADRRLSSKMTRHSLYTNIPGSHWSM